MTTSPANRWQQRQKTDLTAVEDCSAWFKDSCSKLASKSGADELKWQVPSLPLYINGQQSVVTNFGGYLNSIQCSYVTLLLKCFYGILQPCLLYYFAETTKCLQSPKVPENFVQNTNISQNSSEWSTLIQGNKQSFSSSYS